MDDNRNQDSVTYIAKGTNVKADIKTKADIHISGTIHGDIETSQKLVISETGKVTGTVKSDDAAIAGKFTGEMRVLNQINLGKTAVVDGFIFSKVLEVEENASLIGILNIGKDVDVLNAKIKQAERKSVPHVEVKTKDTPARTESPKSKEEPAPKAPSKPKENRYLRDVLIGIPQPIGKEEKEQIRTLSENFMESLGFSLEIFDESNDDTFFQKLSFARNSPEDENEIEKRFANAKERVESALLNKSDNNNGNEQQHAANSIVKSLSSQQEFVFIFGNVLLMQHLENDVQTIAVEFIPEDLSKKLKQSPEMVTKASSVQSFFA